MTRLTRSLAATAALAAVTACSGPEQGAGEAPVDTVADAAEEAEVLESTDEFQTAGSDLGPRDALPGAALYAPFLSPP